MTKNRNRVRERLNDIFFQCFYYNLISISCGNPDTKPY